MGSMIGVFRFSTVDQNCPTLAAFPSATSFAMEASIGLSGTVSRCSHHPVLPRTSHTATRIETCTLFTVLLLEEASTVVYGRGSPNAGESCCARRRPLSTLNSSNCMTQNKYKVSLGAFLWGSPHVQSAVPLSTIEGN